MAIASYDGPLELIEVDEPELRPGFALLEVITCGVCFSDVKTSRGEMPYSDSLKLPHIPGHEICARVVATDPPGAIEVGAVVVAHHIWPCRRCSRCRAGDENLCVKPTAWTGFTDPGGFQEKIAVPIDRLTPVPDGIRPVEAAPLTCALGTAYRAVVSRGRVRPGSHVGIIGLGGVGIHALQVSQATGARAVGLDVSQLSVEAALGLGLDARVNDDAAVEWARMHADGEGLDVVIDCVGHDQTIEVSNRLVRPGGRIVAVGYAMESYFSLPTARHVLDEVELVGSRYVRMDELERAIRLVADGLVRMVVDRTESLQGVNNVMQALESGEIVGRAVLEVADIS